MSFGVSDGVRKKALQILNDNGVVQQKGDSATDLKFVVRSTSGTTYDVNAKITIGKKNEIDSIQIVNCSCPSWSLGKRTYCSHGDSVEMFILGKDSDTFFCNECEIRFISEKALTDHLEEKQALLEEESK
tara:strand:- start:301 stop:690 length:390 start_codon:yes stop_codon:yes gene_type:complete